MPTRFYFRDTISPFTPTAESKSAALPVGTNNSLTINDNESLSLIQGTSDIRVNITSLAQIAQQSGRFARFTSDRLASQVITSDTWSYGIRRQESNSNANTFLALSVYVWRPSTSSVVGYIYDSSAQLGVEWPTSILLLTGSFSGSTVTCNNGDVLVCEVWYTAVQGKSVSYTNSIEFNVSSYIGTTSNIIFFTPSKTRSFAHIIE